METIQQASARPKTRNWQPLLTNRIQIGSVTPGKKSIKEVVRQLLRNQGFMLSDFDNIYKKYYAKATRSLKGPANRFLKACLIADMIALNELIEEGFFYSVP